MSGDNIVIRVVQPNEYEQVIQFLIEHFCRDEPLCSIEPKIELSEDNRKGFLEILKCETSILAMKVKENGEEELVGVNVGVPKDPSSIEEYFKEAEKEGNTKMGQIQKLLGTASRLADVFNRYGVDELLYSYMSCVLPTCRGKNLGSRLKEELVALAKKLGYKLVTVDCTSFYSARVCKRLGWKVISYIPYSEYTDENGVQIFNPPVPHEGLTTLAIEL